MKQQAHVFAGSDWVDRPLPRVFSRPVSEPGVITGLFFIVVTLFPSMLPKTGVTQGLVLGITFMVGYAIGAAWQWIWNFLELPVPRGRWWRVIVRAWYVLLGILLVANLWRHVGWQNTVRDAFGMEEITPTVWLFILPVSLAVAALILIIVRSLLKLFYFIIRWLDRRLPRRLALVLGGGVFLLLLWGLWTGVLVNGFFATANQIFAPIDASTEEGVTQPHSENRSGSPVSLVEWETLGKKGRSYVATGPTVDDLNAFHGGGAMEPIRVYVGLKSADTHEERAQLLLDELIRTDAFDREVLVVATTTGTGFLDPNAMEALEYVTNGNVAVAGAQYSYLPSWISLLADQDEVRETSQITFDTIHEHWSTLPEEERPEIYLYGLSLGSYGVESILRSIEIINHPINGALMVGPPFLNDLWNELVDNRDAGSSPPTPIYEDGQTVRFTTETNAVALPTSEWGDTRILYLQHASDPVVFFRTDLLLEQPDWLMDGQRGAEISEGFIWIPFVTQWQVLIDLPAAGSVPEGFGHLYTREANADAWIAVTEPDNWADADTERLRMYLSALGSPGQTQPAAPLDG